MLTLLKNKKMENIIIDNLKCGGCANTITKGISKIEGISDVMVDVEKSMVSFNTSNEQAKNTLLSKLDNMGYPKQGTSTGFQKAKSYVSCAIGKVS